MAPLDPISGTLGKKAAAHLLRRLTFGPTKQLIDQFAAKTADQAISDLFQPVTLPQETDAELSWLIANPTKTDKIDEGPRIASLKAWWIQRMINSGGNATEKLTFFLHSHFTCIFSVFEKHTAVYYQNKLLRKYALGNIKTIARAISIDNAMLMLLNGSSNLRDSPNENYARELLELYTIGKYYPNPETLGTNDYGNYKESDIQAAAKVLSGYDTELTYTKIDPITGIPRGIVKLNTSALASQHDASIKIFSERFGNRQIAPKAKVGALASEADTLDELDQLINMIFDQPETARNICRKIYRFFVYYNTPSKLRDAANPDAGYELNAYVEDNIITPLANTLRTNNYELRPVYEQLFKSQHFYFQDSSSTTTEDRTDASIIKSPLDLSVGIMRFFKIAATNQEDYKFIADSIKYQGLNLYEPLDVAGYEAYHAFPFYHRAWISANYLAERYLFPKKLMSGMNGDVPLGYKLDVIDFVKNAGVFTVNIGNTVEFVKEAISLLLPEPITAEREDFFLKKLTDSQPEFEWTIEWTEYLKKGDEKVVRGLLENFFWHILKSPEYQLM